MLIVKLSQTGYIKILDISGNITTYNHRRQINEITLLLLGMLKYVLLFIEPWTKQEVSIILLMHAHINFIEVNLTFIYKKY